MKIVVVSRSGREVVKGGIDLPEQALVEDLKKTIYKQTSKFYPARQRLTLPLKPGQARPVVLEDGKALKEYFDVSGGEVCFKDLGPQVSYRTLFFCEYFGPLIIYPLFYFFPSIYTLLGLPYRKETHQAQKLAFWYWELHYAKRIFETFFVHRFSHATSPLNNVFRNCIYYWSFGAFIAYFVNHPLYTPVGEIQMYAGFVFGIICQIANLLCHLELRKLRRADGKSGGYKIPYGFLFNWVTCANYTTEIYQWLGFNIATQTVAGYSFLFAAAFIMTNWALAKHRRLKKLFDGKDGRSKYPRRWVILPPFL